MIPRSAQECCQRGASSQGNGREVNCRRDFNEGFSIELDYKKNVALKTFRFQPDSSQCKIAFLTGEKAR